MNAILKTSNKNYIAKINGKAKAEIQEMAQGRSLYAMNTPGMKGYAFNLDQDGDLYEGMFVGSKEEAEKFGYQGFCPSDTLKLIELV